MVDEFINRDVLERPLVSGFKNDGRRAALIPCVEPQECRDTPAVPRAEARELVLRAWIDEIVAVIASKAYELVGHNCANCVRLDVVGVSVAVTVAKQAGAALAAL